MDRGLCLGPGDSGSTCAITLCQGFSLFTSVVVERFMTNEVILDLTPSLFHVVTDSVVRILTCNCCRCMSRFHDSRSSGQW